MQRGINGRQANVTPETVLRADIALQFFHGSSANGFALRTGIEIKRGVYLIVNNVGALLNKSDFG